MTKILFLDIDGVLNNHAWRVAREDEEVPDFDPRLIDPVLANRIARVLRETGAHVVVSSAWRHHMGSEQMRMMFARLGISVVGRTAPSETNARRGEQIEWWRSEVPHRRFFPYAVVDDYFDAGMGHLDRFVQTDDRFGVTERDANLLIQILNGPPPIS